MMRRFSQLFEEVGAGNLISQVAIDDHTPPRRAWLSKPNLKRDAYTGRLALVDIERNGTALPLGFAIPFFFFPMFRDTVRRATARGFRPDTFQMMDMNDFSAFITRHRDVLTAQEDEAIDGRIDDYRTLSAKFVSRSPWMWRDGLNAKTVKRFFELTRANNIEVW